jgi:oxalate decarboxylase
MRALRAASGGCRSGNNVMISRRIMLRAAAAGAIVPAAATARAGSFGNPDAPPQGAVNATNPASVTDPGPQNLALASQFPAAQSPPPTDVGDLPQFWASFNNAPRRIQNGGWARQVTQADFAISDAISGVNMRLTAGGIRELHWHLAAEWAYVTYGKCRITVLDDRGRADVADVSQGDLWYFPSGFPHSLQGLGPDGCEFVICFDDGKASEFNTTLVTDWLAHTPPDILAQNFGVPADTFSRIPLNDLYIFQGRPPGRLSADEEAIREPERQPPQPFTFRLASSVPVRQTKGGEVRIADSSNFSISKTIAAALVTIRPGGMRELHWHPNADEWQYWIKGKGQMTVFETGPKAVTLNFGPGDIAYVKRNNGHYVKNTGDTDVQFLEVFRSPRFADVSLSDWLTHTPPSLVAQHFNIDEATIAKFPSDRPLVVPE